MANNNKHEALFSHQDITPCVTAVDAANNMSAHYHVYVYDNETYACNIGYNV